MRRYYDKEKAKDDWYDMIKLSWTYARLTEDERNRLANTIKFVKLFGSYDQRWEILQSVYFAFLNALDYKSVGWRETDQDVPLF